MTQIIFDIENAVDVDTPNKDLAEFYNIKGLCYFNSGKFEDSKYYFEIAYKKDPSNYLYPVNIATALIKSNKLEEAVYYFRLGINLAPQQKDLIYDLAKLYISLKRYDEAYELDQTDDKILEMILADIIKFGGECKRCGACCKNMFLKFQGKAITNEEEFNNFCKKDPNYKRWVPYRRWDGAYLFNCSYLTENNTCSKYEERQNLCRKYPNISNVSLQPECGFHQYIDLKPDAIKNIKLLNKIGLHAMLRNLHAEWIKIINERVKSSFAGNDDYIILNECSNSQLALK